MSKRIPGIIHLPLFLLLSISLYQTGMGFSDLFDDVITWGFAVAVTILMYGTTWKIGNKLINQQNVSIRMLLFYFGCFMYSYAGNFNAVYTKYQTEQLYRDELIRHTEQLNDTLAAATKALNNFSPETDERAVRVEQLTQQLVKQITDPARPGLGMRARELISEIEATLGEKLTEFGGTPEKIARDYSANIDDIAKRKFTVGDLGRVNALLEEITDKAVKTNNEIEEVLSDAKYVKDLGYEVNLKVVNTINEIGTKTSAFIKNPTQFKFEKVHFENQEIGKIAFSFESAFTQHFFIAILLTILCFFLDWAVVICLFVYYREVEPYKPRKFSADL